MLRICSQNRNEASGGRPVSETRYPRAFPDKVPAIGTGDQEVTLLEILFFSPHELRRQSNQIIFINFVLYILGSHANNRVGRSDRDWILRFEGNSTNKRRYFPKCD